MNTATTVWCDDQGISLCADHLPDTARAELAKRPRADYVPSRTAVWFREVRDDEMFCEVCGS